VAVTAVTMRSCRVIRSAATPASSQARPPAEEAESVESDFDGPAGIELAERDSHAGEIPGTQHRVRQVRHMATVSMRAQARYAERLQLVPQCTDRAVASGIEQQTHCQRHVITRS
jgi:hypothetical protein